LAAAPLEASGRRAIEEDAAPRELVDDLVAALRRGRMLVTLGVHVERQDDVVVRVVEHLHGAALLAVPPLGGRSAFKLCGRVTCPLPAPRRARSTRVARHRAPASGAGAEAMGRVWDRATPRRA